MTMIEYEEANQLLEFIRKLRFKEQEKNKSFLFRLFRIRRSHWKKPFQEQWKITETLYHKTDEYKKTRGY